MSGRVRRATAAVGVAAVLLTATWAAAPSPVAADDGAAHAHHGGDRKLDAVELRLQMRKLWEDHITWTRLFIVAAESGAPDTAAVAARLLANQDDIGAAIAPYYGPAAGAALTALLREHILVAADLVHAAVVGDAAGANAASTAWYANADAVAAFLSAANPKAWPLDAMRTMMRTHLDQTLAEATHHLTGAYGDDIADYERIHVHILAMADDLTAGIVQQFPGRFRH